jgi:hypothetical protein
MDYTNAEPSIRRLGGRGVLRGVSGGRRGGGVDPWLCDPGFCRVCLYRGMCLDSETLRSGTRIVKRIWR